MPEFGVTLDAIFGWEVGLAFLISTVGAGLALANSRRGGPIDVPNHRSSHVTPTPRGGGIGIVLTVLIAGGLAVLRRPPGFELQLLGIAAAVVLVAVVGWLDDRGGASITARLAVHIGAALCVAVLVDRIAPVPGWVHVLWLGGWMFWSVASINIVNFMDGIDGLVAGQAVVFGAYIALLCGFPTPAAGQAMILASAAAGFLLWNWAPARIFMGDVGSGPLGLLFATLGALALPHARAELVFLPLLPLYMDALLTMVARARRGERLTQAHRSHLYQRMANGSLGHARVAAGYAFAAAIGGALGLSLATAPPLGEIIGISVYALVVLFCWHALDRRHPLS